jgi:cobalt-zinc-cadmium resistance protein CzcA
MKRIIGLSLRYRFAVFFFTLVVIVGGAVSFMETPIEAFPDVTNTQVVIITQWPGRSGEEIEKFVTIPIEIAMNSVQKKTSVRSTSLFGLSVINVMFDDGVDNQFARIQVNNQIQNVTLPDGVDPEIEPPYGPTGEIFRYTLSSPGRTVRELKTIQDWVLDRQFKSIPGIADVNSFGGEVKTYEVQVNPAQLSNYDVTALDVNEAIQHSNLNIGGDVISRGQESYVVRGIGLLTNTSDIERIMVKNNDGSPVYIRSLANVMESSLPRLGQVGRGNQNDVVEGIVVMRKNENPSEVIKAVNAKVAELNSRILPQDVRINTFYNRQTLIDFCTETVLHNMGEGIFLVTLIVFLFLADWRTSLIVAMIIPLALLFAFSCMYLKGMHANLLSLGAVDFGIIIDGTVVMVEGILVVLSYQAETKGMEKFNKMFKFGLIKNRGADMGKAIFTSKIIILLALLPIFAFHKVEGKMFTPLAWTLGFALVGATLFSLTLVPVLISILLNKDVREKSNFFVRGIHNGCTSLFNFTFSHRRNTLIAAACVLFAGLYTLTLHGTEFLPQLNEGSIYVRASMPRSVNLETSVRYANEFRKIFERQPEVHQVLSQTGRPNDGTDPTGFYNIEFMVDLYPQKEWKSGLKKPELISKIQQQLSVYPGVDFNFSQPIMDNVEEAVSGVKGSIALKIYGRDFDYLATQANIVYDVMKKVSGIEDLGIVQNLGQPELRIELDQEKMDIYGIQTADAQAVISLAIGGQSASQMFEGERRFDIRVRYLPEYRRTDTEIGNILVPTQKGTKIPLKDISTIRYLTGPSLIFREDNLRFIAVKFSIRGRDMGSTIQEAQEGVDKVVHLQNGYFMKWKGDFENQQRATKTLETVVPISLVMIFFVLYLTFGNLRDAGLVFLNVPFAIIGGSLALLITGTNFSISAGIGFIALFGICVQDAVIMISAFKENLNENMNLETSIREGVKSRIRPVFMTAMMGTCGLLPAAISTGIGSESQKPLAIVVIGGLVSAAILTLFIFPLIFETIYERKLKKEKQRKQPK